MKWKQFLCFYEKTWTLNQSEKQLFDQTDIYAWKKMIGLPQTSPTAGIILTMGSMFATVQVGIKPLTYLHKVLNKDKEGQEDTLYHGRVLYRMGKAD